MKRLIALVVIIIIRNERRVQVFWDSKIQYLTHSKDNNSFINKHYKMIPLNSLPYINDINKTRISQSDGIDHSMRYNKNINKPLVKNKNYKRELSQCYYVK